MASSALGTVRVISTAVTPPATNASAIGITCSARSVRTTAITPISRRRETISARVVMPKFYAHASFFVQLHSHAALRQMSEERSRRHDVFGGMNTGAGDFASSDHARDNRRRGTGVYIRNVFGVAIQRDGPSFAFHNHAYDFVMSQRSDLFGRSLRHRDLIHDLDGLDLRHGH